MFVRGGLTGPGSPLFYAGNGGYYQSSTAVDSYYTYNLYFDLGGINLSGRYGRHVGLSVRCVALGG